MKAKLIHLDEKVIETLSIKAIKERTTFKEMVQKLLTKIATDYNSKPINNNPTKRNK